MNELHQIITLAEALADSHKGANSGGDPFKAFHDFEVILVEKDFGDAFEGLLRYHDNEYQVFINAGNERAPRTTGRKRFTAAHEFAHYTIKEHRDAIRLGRGLHKDFNGFSSNEPMEREADIFAAHFLIPTDKLLRRCRNPNWGAKEILDVAKHFDTSITCAALRCQSTLPGNSTIIVWGPDGFRWQRMDNDWWFQLPARSIRAVDQITKGSATEEVLNGGSIPECGYVRKGTTRSAWFKRVSTWSNQNMILVEEVISLGSYGCLTLLRPDSSGL